MKKFAVSLIILSVLITALAVTAGIKIGNDVNKYAQELKFIDINAKENIGNRIVINKDTLMIVDYSLINKTYTLETGVKVNFNLVNEKNIISK
jgi:hypothetical protein